MSICNIIYTNIANIPNHFFNKHDYWGSCNYHENKKNYKHQVIGDGFKDITLLKKLETLFGSLANKSDSFASGASSNKATLIPC